LVKNKMSPLKVLVVDDYEPICRLVCSILEKAEFQVVGQASDGLEALSKAEELRPDLILLDIGLPKLNGMDAARRLLKLTPHAKIIFLSQESSPDVVQEALNLGALGYVHKSRVHRELLSAIDSALAGRRFMGSGLNGHKLPQVTNGHGLHCHEILIYSDDAVLVNGFSRFIASALNAGNPAMIVVTEPHRESILQKLRKDGVAVDAAMQQGTCVWLDSAEALDPVRFHSVVRDIVDAASKRGKAGRPRAAICGEVAGRLWAEGKTDEALQIEQKCNDLARAHEMDILCSYPLDASQGEEAQYSLKRISAEHSAVLSR
jgi:CheY-like chemotaxis protein